VLLVLALALKVLARPLVLLWPLVPSPVAPLLVLPLALLQGTLHRGALFRIQGKTRCSALLHRRNSPRHPRQALRTAVWRVAEPLVQAWRIPPMQAWPV
jgi:hypothetical protein